jgi:hypothetical protein
MDNHFGLLTINFADTNPHVVAEVWDIRGNQRVEHIIPFAEISFGKE